MKIGQIIKEKRRILSFEFFPPKDKSGEDRLMENVGSLAALNPDFVSVTYGAGGGTAKNTKQLVGRLRRETSLVPMPHLTCVDQDMDELKRILEDYRQIGVENVLALRGDPPESTQHFIAPEGGFCYARELVSLAASMSSFSIAVAVYPEGHCESPSLDTDMYYTKQKIDAGADFAITQMFFDNRYYYDFLERAIKAGIKIPIIPGIMPIIDLGKILRFSKKCGATVPARVIRAFEKAGDNAVEARKVGIEAATGQCADLIAHSVPYLHFYTLNQADVVMKIVRNLGLADRAQKQQRTQAQACLKPAPVVIYRLSINPGP